MSGTVQFARQLGEQAGIQLNALVDQTARPSVDQFDQLFAAAVRLTRGRIDKAFLADKSTFRRLCGNGETIRANALNEGWAQLDEALKRGAMGAVVSRLITSAAQVKWALITLNGTGGATAFSVGTTTAPNSGFSLAFKHLGCHNDGIKFALHADENSGEAQPVLTVAVKDADGETVLGPYTGSLTAGATDDYGNSLYLPDIIAARTDLLECLVATGTTVQATSDAYGYDTAGKPKWVTSATLSCFVEGGTAYGASDYTAATDRLRKTNLVYGYIAGGGSQASGLLYALAMLAWDTDRQFRFDVPGNLNPEEAAQFIADLGIADDQNGILLHSFWAPFKSTDPSGLNGKCHLGTSAYNIARACYRNSQVNSFELAPKNFPIAGKGWRVNRAGIEQTYFPSAQEFNALAKAKINPVIEKTFSDGSYTVFADSITMAPVVNSKRLFINVAEMETDISNRMTRLANDCLHLPFTEFSKQMRIGLEFIGTAAAASKWVIPLETSDDEDIASRGWKFVVTQSSDRYDTANVIFYGNFDGTVRRVIITPVLAG